MPVRMTTCFRRGPSVAAGVLQLPGVDAHLGRGDAS